MKLKKTFRNASLVAAAGALTALLVACGGSSDEPASAAGHNAGSDSAAGHKSAAAETDPAAHFNAEMRKLWEDHVAWTRLAIVSLANDLPDSAATTERLLRNQVDIGDAVKPFYGDAAGSALTALLDDHIEIAAGIVVSAKAGDSAAVETGQADWYQNADAIGGFLSAANPDNWEPTEMKAMMREHLDLTLQEAVHYLQGDHQASIADYNHIREQILGMADMLSAGIIAQFPDTFSQQSRGR
jgi:hypothetical protein